MSSKLPHRIIGDLKISVTCNEGRWKEITDEELEEISEILSDVKDEVVEEILQGRLEKYNVNIG